MLSSLITALFIALAIMFSYKEYENIITPEKKGRYWIPALLWGVSYLIHYQPFF